MHLASKLVLAVAFLAWSPAPGLTALSGPASDADVTTLSFTILRDGAPFGTHSTTIRRDGGRLLVETKIAARLDLAFVTLYRFRHESREEWRGGRLVGLDAFTDDDGRTTRVTAHATPAGLMVNGPNGPFLAPPDSMPTTFWHAAFLAAPRLLDVQEGRLAKVAVEPGGAANAAGGTAGQQRRHVTLTGDLQMDLWFEPDGSLSGTRFLARGYEITYRRERNELADSR